MKLLVTGATGFVGSWMVKKLLDSGHSVRILRRESSSLAELAGLDVEHAIGDVVDSSSVSKACSGIDSVFHLAGVIGYTPAMRALMEKVNVLGTANVISACRANNVRRLVHMSSVVAIGAGFKPSQVLNEESEFNVHHLNLGYFETKKQAEDLVVASAKANEVDAVILNPSTIYGPGDAKKGSRKTQLKVARGKFPFYTSGGVNVVDVDDVTSAIYTAWKQGETAERYILCSENILIKDLFRMIAKEAGAKPPWIYLPNPVVKMLGKIGDRQEAKGKKGLISSENAWTSILYHWFDNSKAKEKLGFNPRPAAESIHRSIQWVKDNELL